VDFEDRRVGLEERFSGLSEGQRYALALVLNLAFVGVVIAGFALLYTTGFDTRPSEPAAASQAELRDGVEEDLGGPSLLASRSEDPIISLPSESGIEDLPTEESPSVPSEAAPVAAPPPPPTEEEPPQQLAILETPPPAVETAPAAPAGGNLWVEAGELLASLRTDFPCSSITLDSGPDNNPVLQARVGPSEDVELLRARISPSLRNQAEVGQGVGCTTVIGGGYMALTDINSTVLLLDGASLSRDVRAVLPAQAACPAIGAVVGAQPAAVQQRIELAGRPATWVRSANDPALCERDDAGTWRVVPATAGRRAAVIVPSDDVRAAQVLQGSPAIVAAAPPPQAEPVPTPAAPPVVVAPPPAPSTMPRIPATRPEPPVAEATETLAALTEEVVPPVRPAAPAASAPDPAPAQPTRSANAEAREVNPLPGGPSPQLPPGTEPLPEGNYAVSVGFFVDSAGRASDLSLLEGGNGNGNVVSAAFDIVSGSRFPPAEGERYRARHTVRFPSAAISAALDSIRREVTAAPPPAAPIAEPLWDRGATPDDLARYFPKRALQRGVGGEVLLECAIDFDGKLNCEVSSENPRSWGFGAAAISLSEFYRAGPRLKDGRPSANEVVTLQFSFPEPD
jgi:hypothetical protein